MNLKKWLSEFIKRFLVGGLSIKEALQLQKLNLMAKVKALINGAVIDGVKPDLTALFNRAKQYLQTTAHTWANAVSNGVLLGWGKKRVLGWRHISVLDSRTSAVCTVRHGKLWDREHSPIGHDLVFHAPPLHPNCRSMLVPASLDEPFEGITGEDWVKSRSLAALQEQFGVGIGQMLYDGAISLHDAVRQGGLVPMTLGELKQKYLFATGDANLEDFLRQWLGVESYHNMAKVLRREDILPYMHEYGLSEVEGVILRYYTGQGASILNGALYGGQPSQQIEQLAEIMQQALSKLPNYQGIVIRRTNLRELLKQHTVGNIVEYPAFISGSFGGIEVFSEKLHRLEIVSMKGKRIDWISDSDENEVVFLLGSRFRVINKLGRGFFELRELG